MYVKKKYRKERKEKTNVRTLITITNNTEMFWIGLLTPMPQADFLRNVEKLEGHPVKKKTLL